MSWDWDAEDINLDEDDGRTWIPITPKTFEDEETQTVEVKWSTSEDEEELHAVRDGPHRTMSMYVVSCGPTGVVQALTPIRKVVGMPIIGPGETNQSPSEVEQTPREQHRGRELIGQTGGVRPAEGQNRVSCTGREECASGHV